MKAHWIDNGDSWICPVCGFETGNPNYHNAICPTCGFQDVKDRRLNMRVYARNECYNFDHQEDMKMILDYLNEHGKIFVKYSVIEDLYYEFSSDKYEAGWMSVNEQMLEEFEEWMNNYDGWRGTVVYH